MKKKLLMVLCTVSGVLYAMGTDVNYDEKFDSAEKSQMTTTVTEPVATPTPIVKKEVVASNPLEGLVIKTLYFQKKTVDHEGAKAKKYVEVKDALVESKVTYINKLINTTNKTKKDVVIKNPIPKGVEYVLGTASCLDDCTIRYSADNGKTLVANDKGGENYNYLEFTFSTVPPKKEFRMGFDTIIK
jgi:uncharacterized repeat protein (TIGR01451 family)